MVIGIISDTHDNIPNIKKIVEILKEKNAEFVIHCGDIIAPMTIEYFKGLKMKFVFGNCDGDKHLIEEEVVKIGGEHYGNVMELKYKGKTIGVYHSHNIIINDKMLNKGYDYYLHGHTHIPEDKMHGKTRVLCPGGHYLGDPQEHNQLILLDVEKDKPVFIDVNTGKKV